MKIEFNSQEAKAKITGFTPAVIDAASNSDLHSLQGMVAELAAKVEALDSPFLQGLMILPLMNDLPNQRLLLRLYGIDITEVLTQILPSSNRRCFYILNPVTSTSLVRIRLNDNEVTIGSGQVYLDEDNYQGAVQSYTDLGQSTRIIVQEFN